MIFGSGSEQVKGYDTDAVGAAVTGAWPHVDQIWVLALSDGSTIDTTANHPWWVASERGFVRTDHLVAGDLLVTADGTTLTVESVGATDRWEATYNLTATGAHTYHVSEASSSTTARLVMDLTSFPEGPSLGLMLRAKHLPICRRTMD